MPALLSDSDVATRIKSLRGEHGEKIVEEEIPIELPEDEGRQEE